MNINHAIRIGLRQNCVRIGFKHHLSKQFYDKSNGQIYGSMNEASKKVGINLTTFSRYINGNKKRGIPDRLKLRLDQVVQLL